MEKTKQMVSIKECAKLTGLPYGWLLDQVLRGIPAPPSYQLPGHKRRLVIVEEVMEWAKQQRHGGVLAMGRVSIEPKTSLRKAMLHAPANKDGIVVQPPMSETEKLRLYMNQLERRVRALEAQVKELADD